MLSTLKPNQVFSQVIDAKDNWEVIKLIKKLPAEKFLVEAVALPKEEFDPWFEKEKLKLLD